MLLQCVHPTFVLSDYRLINITAIAANQFSRMPRKKNTFACHAKIICMRPLLQVSHHLSLAILVNACYRLGEKWITDDDDGVMIDIKKAIACLLMGGSKKILPDGMRLRGDISVLLLGDPGTAKSQLLKFVEKVAPIAVYTSGKGSSAAGLTASVIRDPSTVGHIYMI